MYKYVCLFFVFACTFCSCDLGKFYAHKRIGGSAYPTVYHKTSDHVSSDIPVAQDTSAEILPQTPAQPVYTVEKINNEKVAVKSFTTCAQKQVMVTPIFRKTTHTPVEKPVGVQNSTKGGGKAVFLLFLYALIFACTVAIPAFFIAWIFVSSTIALHIALWIGLGAFVLGGLLLFLAILFMGDHHKPGPDAYK